MDSNKMLREELEVTRKTFEHKVEGLLDEQKRLYNDKAKLIERLQDAEWLLKYLDIVIKLADVPDAMWTADDSKILHDIRTAVVAFKKRVYNV